MGSGTWNPIIRLAPRILISILSTAKDNRTLIKIIRLSKNSVLKYSANTPNC